MAEPRTVLGPIGHLWLQPFRLDRVMPQQPASHAVERAAEGAVRQQRNGLLTEPHLGQRVVHLTDLPQPCGLDSLRSSRGAGKTAHTNFDTLRPSEPNKESIDMPSVPARCQPIADELAATQSTAASLKAEYNSLPPGPERSQVFRQWRAALTAEGQLAIQLNQCIHLLAPLPDLIPSTNIVQNLHPDSRDPAVTVFDWAPVAMNIGNGAATGVAFEIALAVEYVAAYQDPPLYGDGAETLTVPASVVINPGGTYTPPLSDFFQNIPILFRPGTSEPAVFTFWVTLNSDHALQESDETNNSEIYDGLIHQGDPMITIIPRQMFRRRSGLTHKSVPLRKV